MRPKNLRKCFDLEKREEGSIIRHDCYIYEESGTESSFPTWDYVNWLETMIYQVTIPSYKYEIGDICKTVRIKGRRDVEVPIVLRNTGVLVTIVDRRSWEVDNKSKNSYKVEPVDRKIKLPTNGGSFIDEDRLRLVKREKQVNLDKIKAAKKVLEDLELQSVSRKEIL